MSVLKYFKNIPRSPTHRATGPKCNFFSSNSQRSPWRKKKDLSPVGGATGACRPAHGRPPLGPAHGRGRGPVAHPPRATGGPVAPPGDRVMTPYISSTPPFPYSFEPENSTKNPEKKREEWGEGKRRSPAGFSTCDLQVSTFSLNIVISTFSLNIVIFKYYVFKYE